MLHHFHGSAIRLQICAPRHFHTVGSDGRYDGRPGQVAAQESDSNVGSGGSKFNPHIETTPKAKPFDGYRFGNRLLLAEQELHDTGSTEKTSRDHRIARNLTGGRTLPAFGQAGEPQSPERSLPRPALPISTRRWPTPDRPKKF
jgi:hypothetical protein